MAYHIIPPIAPMAQIPTPAICTNQYSSLQEQRLYLLSALAEEEDRGERLTRAFEALNSKLKKLESAHPPTSSPKLRQFIRGIRHKIGNCQRRERALADNLAQIVAHMEGLKRFQWRAAQHTYAQQYQRGQMMVMSPGFGPGFALQSPMTLDLVPDMQYLSLQQPLTARFQQQYGQPCASMNTYYPTHVSPQMPLTPTVVPQAQYASSVDCSSLYAGLPAETCADSKIGELAEAIIPCDSSSRGIDSLPLGYSNIGRPNPSRDGRGYTITIAQIPGSNASNVQVSRNSTRAGATTRRLNIVDLTSADFTPDRKPDNDKGQRSA